MTIAPTAPGSIGEAIDPRAAQLYLQELDEWVRGRRTELDELDAAALAQEAELTASGELQPSSEDVAGELPDDEFDRAVDAGTAGDQQ